MAQSDSISNENQTKINQLRAFAKASYNGEKNDIPTIVNSSLKQIELGFTSDDMKTRAMAQAALDDLDEIRKIRNLVSLNAAAAAAERSKSILENSIIIAENNKKIQKTSPGWNKNNDNFAIFTTTHASVSNEENQAFEALNKLYNDARAGVNSSDNNKKAIAQNTLNQIKNNLLPFFEENSSTSNNKDKKSNYALLTATIKAHSNILKDSSTLIDHHASAPDASAAMKKVVTEFGTNLALLETNSDTYKNKKTAVDVLWRDRSLKMKAFMLIMLVLAAAALVGAAFFLGPLAVPVAHASLTTLIYGFTQIAPFFQFAFSNAHMLIAYQATLGQLITPLMHFLPQIAPASQSLFTTANMLTACQVTYQATLGQLITPLMHFYPQITPFFQSVFSNAHMITAFQATFGGISSGGQYIGAGLGYMNAGAKSGLYFLQTGLNQIGAIATLVSACALKSIAQMPLTAKIAAGVAAGVGAGLHAVAALASSPFRRNDSQLENKKGALGDSKKAPIGTTVIKPT